MFKEKRVAVIVPAYNEEKLIGSVIETMPDFVDLIIVVDDAASDGTGQVVSSYKEKLKERLEVVTHTENLGVGAAIISGYKKAMDEGMDIMAVMAGDAQMDPKELEIIISPVAEGKADYTKGNRLFSGDAWKVIPKIRYFASAFLSFLTKVISGYWHIADSQCGFTAISSKALKMLELERIYKRYGFPNDMLTELNIFNLRVKDISVRPIYHVGETSGIRYERIIFTLSFLLCRLFGRRMWQKYVIRDFHPLILFYLFGIVFSISGIALGALIVFVKGYISLTIVVFCAILLVSGLQFLLFAMWFDMEYNKDLCIK